MICWSIYERPIISARNRRLTKVTHAAPKINNRTTHACEQTGGPPPGDESFVDVPIRFGFLEANQIRPPSSSEQIVQFEVDQTSSPTGGTWRPFHGETSNESKDTKSPRWDLMSESKCKLMRNETTATRSSSYTNNSNSNNKANRIPFSLKNVSVIFVEWARPVVTVAELMLMNVSTHFSLPYGPFRRSTAQVSGRRSAPFI